MKITPNRIKMYNVFQDELENRVHVIFNKYKSLELNNHGTVESWSIDNDSINIKQDTSFRGHRDCEYYALPITYLYMSNEELTTAILTEKQVREDIKNSTKEQHEAEAKAYRHKEYLKLQQEFQ